MQFNHVVLVTLDVLYYMPDYQHLLQQFVWHTNDVLPRFPKIEKFLLNWKLNNSVAPIHSVTLYYDNGKGRDFINARGLFDL